MNMAVLDVKSKHRAELLQGLSVLVLACGAVSVHKFSDGWVVTVPAFDNDKPIRASLTLDLALESAIRRHTTFFEDRFK